MTQPFMFENKFSLTLKPIGAVSGAFFNYEEKPVMTTTENQDACGQRKATSEEMKERLGKWTKANLIKRSMDQDDYIASLTQSINDMVDRRNQALVEAREQSYRAERLAKKVRYLLRALKHSE